MAPTPTNAPPNAPENTPEVSFTELRNQEVLVHPQHIFMAAKAEQAIQRVLDVPGIATAGAQDIVNDRFILQHSLLLKITQVPGETGDRFERVADGFHRPPFGLGRCRADCSLACFIA